MDLTPNDVRNREFSSQMRGFDREQVANFQEEVARAMEALKQENTKFQIEIGQLQSQVESLKPFEDAIKGAAIDARRNADKLLADAKAEAARVLERAKQAAEEVVRTRSQQAQDLREQIQQLEQARQSYLQQLTSLLKSHMGEIKSVEAIQPPELPEKLDMPDVQSMIDLSDLPDLTPELETPEDAIEVTDSSEMRRTRRETIATQPSRKEQSIRTEEANAPSKIVAKATEEPVVQEAPPTPEPPATPEPPPTPEPPATNQTPAVPETPAMETPKATTPPADEEQSDEDLTESLRKMVQDEERRQEKEAQVAANTQAQTPPPSPPQPQTGQPSAEAPADQPPQTPETAESTEDEAMDPDLAAALESYTHHNAKQEASVEPNPVNQGDTPPPLPGDEKPKDVPEGFIAAGQEDLSGDSTDPVQINKTGEGQQRPKPTDVMDPEAFARELDSIADRFEEEISKVDRK